MITEIWEWIIDPVSPFFRYALLVAIAAAIPMGVVGTCVVTRRITYLAAAIAHAAMGGIGLALYLRHAREWGWVNPTLGALLFSVLAVLAIAWIQRRDREREDVAIGAVWAVGMSIGLLFLTRTPGYIDVQSYLFGNILLVGPFDLWLLLGFTGLLLLLLGRWYRVLEAVLFDPEQARLVGLPVNRIQLLLLVLVAVSVVLMVSVMGMILVIALLTLPAATAARLAGGLRGTMLLASLLAALSGVGGLLLSYPLDWPSGPTIVLVAAGFFLLSRMAVR